MREVRQVASLLSAPRTAWAIGCLPISSREQKAQTIAAPENTGDGAFFGIAKESRKVIAQGLMKVS